jgi:hypothetical protein
VQRRDRRLAADGPGVAMNLFAPGLRMLRVEIDPRVARCVMQRTCAALCPVCGVTTLPLQVHECQVPRLISS